MVDHDVRNGQHMHAQTTTAVDKLKVGAVSVAVCAGLGLGAVSVYPPQFANADPVVQPAATKALSEIEIPAYAGIYARDFWNHGGDAIKKDAIIAYAKEVLKPLGVSDQVQYSISDEDFKKAIAETGGYFREAASGDVTLTLTEGSTTKTTKIKTVFFQPPYVQRSNTKQEGDPKPRSFEGSHTSHNQGKLNVADPDNYTLTSDQKTKLINDFKNANKKLALPDSTQYEMDEKGNLTLSYEQDGKKLSTTISRDYFISDVAFVPDILVFHKPDGTNAKSEPLKKPLFIKLRKDKDYKKFWTANGVGIGNVSSGWAKDLKVEKVEDAEGKRLKITGAYTKLGATPNRSRGRYEIYGKYGIGVAPEDTDRGYNQSFTNIFRVRVLRVHDTTYIRCVDEEANERYDFDKDIKEKLGVNWSELKKYNAPDDANSVTDDQVREEVKKRVDVVAEDTNPTLEHKAGVQVFKGHAVLKDQGNQASPTSTATRIYYTKHIPVTVVSDQNHVSEAEKEIIRNKVKQANGFDANKNPFEVDVADDGRITIKYNVKHTDKNGKQKDTFTADLGRPVQQFRFKDSEVKPGGKVNVDKPAQVNETDPNKIKQNDKGEPVLTPEGTTYKAPGEDPSTPGTKTPFTVDVAHGDGKVVVTVTPKDDGTFDISVPEGTEPDITLDVPINVCLPNQTCAVITAKVHVLKPDNKLFEPKGGAIEHKFGEGTSKEDIFSKVEVKSEKDGKFDENGTTPKDNEMPVLSVDEGKVPTGEESGKFEIEVTATYPDGTKDKTTVTVVVGPEAPVVSAKDDGSVTVKLPEDPGADKVTITYKKDGADKTITLTKEGGAWKLPDGTEGVTLENGVVTISADEVDDETEVSATSTNSTIQKTSDVSKDTSKKPVSSDLGGVPVPDPANPNPAPNPNGEGNTPSGNADNPSGNADGNTGSSSGEGGSSNASSTNQNSNKKPAKARRRAMRKVPQTGDLFGLGILGGVATLGGAFLAGFGMHKKHEDQ